MRFWKLLLILPLLLEAQNLFAWTSEPSFCVASPGECTPLADYWDQYEVNEAEVRLAEQVYNGLFAVRLSFGKNLRESVYIRVTKRTTFVKDVRRFCNESEKWGVPCQESPMAGEIKFFSGSNPAKFLMGKTIQITLSSVNGRDATHVWSMSDYCEKVGEVYAVSCMGKIVMDRVSFSDPYENHMVLLSAKGDCFTYLQRKRPSVGGKKLEACPGSFNFQNSFPMNQGKAAINCLKSARYQIGDNTFFRVRYKQEN